MFPLPFRVLFLLSSGILAWATNLHGLHHHAIDGPGVLHLDRPSLPTIRSPSSKLTPHPPPSYRPVYRLFTYSAIWCLSIWLIYRHSTASHVEYVDVFKYLPAVGTLGLVIGLVCPFDILELREREKFLSCVVFPALHLVEPNPVWVVQYTGVLYSRSQEYTFQTWFSRISSLLTPRFSGISGFHCGCCSQGVVCSYCRPRRDGRVGFCQP